MVAPCDLLVLAAFPPSSRGSGARSARGCVIRLEDTMSRQRRSGSGSPPPRPGRRCALVAYRPRGVVLVGTCGVVRGCASRSGASRSRAAWCSRSRPSRGARRRIPEPMSTELNADPALARSASGARGTARRRRDDARGHHRRRARGAARGVHVVPGRAPRGVRGGGGVRGARGPVRRGARRGQRRRRARSGRVATEPPRGIGGRDRASSSPGCAPGRLDWLAR